MRVDIRRQNSSAVTLLELLCVMAIITILAGLLLGPAARALKKARADQWSDRADAELQSVLRQLRVQYQGRTDFPTVTLEQIGRAGVLGSSQLAFLRDRRVTFIPFAGADPDDQVVICVRLERGFLSEGGVLTETKGAITALPE